MTSILTNTGAMVALQSLQATQKSLAETQNHISTGLKVQTAKDDASSWTIATTMKANVASLNQVSSGLGNADSILGTAVSGLNQLSSLVSQIRSKVASFTDTSQDPTAIQAQVTQLTNQMNAVIKSSSFNGVNLLDHDTAVSTGSGTVTDDQVFEASTANDYNATGAASTTIGTGLAINLSVGGKAASTSADATTQAFGALVADLKASITSGDTYATSATNTGTASAPSYALTATPGTTKDANGVAANLDNALKTIDAFAATVKSQAAQYGAVQQNVESQQTFVKNLSDTMSSGVSNMVDADMTAESARLSALQTQQQLGTQALSIANQAPQSILKLFG